MAYLQYRIYPIATDISRWGNGTCRISHKTKKAGQIFLLLRMSELRNERLLSSRKKIKRTEGAQRGLCVPFEKSGENI